MNQGATQDQVRDYVELVPLRARGAELHVPAADPRPAWRVFLGRHALVLLTFVLPCLVGVLYFGLLTADRYTSEAQFVVRSPNKTSVDQLSSMIKSTGTERASDEAGAVHQYVRSRDAVDLLVRQADLRAILSRPEGDPFWRFPGWFSRDLREKLFDRYLSLISIKQDSGTGISTLVVQSFRPEDSVRMAQVLLEGSEALINRLNERSRRDAIKAAEAEVEAAKERAFERREELTAFRTRAGTVDPAKTSQSLLETIGKLSFESAQANAQLAEAQRSAPQGPQIANLRNRIQAVEQQIVEERRRIGGSAQALAPVIADYERLVLEREFADRVLASALASLENARLESQRQQLYLERVVEPHAADYPSQPKRLFWIGIVMVLSFSTFVILRALINNVRAHEH
ncbi:MAG TPA: capsule biosynthesis protein [Bosea sp. (in: a-proteobacteria)]|jgi:capsular polysaccharide transport system permease protein|uniref:capsule biosynthesis protein n=1 Tax=Bosea sp. (in: a-proteobacteria) TaxID=1871050 RepID=UPI002E11C71A|nr:capsule biosynthesis protein [Bosea sp. (in: a-proteobacteria)]